MSPTPPASASSSNKPFPIRVVSIGPGSQPEEDEDLHYLPMPKDMHAFSQPALPVHYADIPAVVTEQVIEALQAVAQGVQQVLAQQQTLSVFTYDMQHLPSAVQVVFDHSLATGEVSIVVGAADGGCIRIEETAFAGLWRLRRVDAEGKVLHDSLQVADIPDCVRGAAQGLASQVDTYPPLPADAMNAQALMHEVQEQAGLWQSGQAAHVINFTLLPTSQGDLDYVTDSLGNGPVVILSRGYGNCRISSTRLRHVWWVQYGNSMDQIILNTLEVVDVPSVVLAAREDIADSLERLRELIATLQAE